MAQHVKQHVMVVVVHAPDHVLVDVLDVRVHVPADAKLAVKAVVILFVAAPAVQVDVVLPAHRRQHWVYL